MRSKSCFHFLTFSNHENIEYSRYSKELKLLSERFTGGFSDFKDIDNIFNIFANSCIMLKILRLPTNGVDRAQEDSYLKSKSDDVELSKFYRT